jgi:hypothetical protein
MAMCVSSEFKRYQLDQYCNSKVHRFNKSQWSSMPCHQGNPTDDVTRHQLPLTDLIYDDLQDEIW